LRGKDIHKYYYEWAGLWLIFVPWHFPFHNNIYIQGASKEAEDAFKMQYSGIYNHLLKFKNKLEKRNKTETCVRYEWYALQRCAATYYNEFNKNKIIWPEIGLNGSFTYDTKQFYTSNACFIMTGENLIYILAILNSKLFDFYFNLIASNLSQKANMYFKIYIEQFPIPVYQKTDTTLELERLVNNILKIMPAINSAQIQKNLTSKVSEYLNRIDTLVYKLYGLNEKDIKIISEPYNSYSLMNIPVNLDSESIS